MPNILLLEKIALQCGALIKQMWERGVATYDKDETLGAHFATDADSASQDLGIKLVAESYPQEIIIAEEQENQLGIPANCTVFDPLDGTTNYLNGAPEYGVTLCTLREGQPELGVMYWPHDDVLISAVRGHGCWRGGFRLGKQLKIPSWHGMRDKILVATDVGPWIPHEVLRPIADKHNVKSYMAGIHGARMVLEGSAVFYFNLDIAKVWDGAAGALAVEEAGGLALSWSGEPLRWNTLNLDWFYARDQEMADYALSYLKAWKPRR